VLIEIVVGVGAKDDPSFVIMLQPTEYVKAVEPGDEGAKHSKLKGTTVEPPAGITIDGIVLDMGALIPTFVLTVDCALPDTCIRGCNVLRITFEPPLLLIVTDATTG
jgi:hypothetical protein